MTARAKDRTAGLACLIGAYAASVAVMPTLAGKLALAAPLMLAPMLWWTLAGPRRWIALFLCAAALLPPLPIALGDSGPHPALAIAALGVLIGLLRRAEWRFERDAVSAALLLFLCVLVGSAGWAAFYSGLNVAAGSLVRVALLAISVYVYLYTRHGPASPAIDPLGAARLLFGVGVAAAVFACIDFYYQLPAPAGYGAQFVWLTSGVFRRAQGLFYEASTLGNFCAFFLVMAAVALFQPRMSRPLPRTWLILGSVVLAAALIFSYSRASVVNVAVALVALAVLRRVRVVRVLLGVGVAAAAAAALVYRAFPSFAESYWVRLSGSLDAFWTEPAFMLSGRWDSWRTLVNFLIEQPGHAIFGLGYKTLPYSDYVGSRVITDNMYLSLLVETGIVGLGSFALLNYAMLRRAWRAAKTGPPVAAFFGTWIFCFWTGQLAQMMSGDLLTYWRVLPFYFFVLAMAGA